MRRHEEVLSLLLSVPGTAGGLAAQQGQDLGKQLANPIANLISVPFQSNLDFAAGSGNGVQYTLNFQPVIPTPLSRGWNMINRVIVPLVNRERPVPGAGSAFGLGDITHSLFFSPDRTEPLIWGAGPVLVYPTATDDRLGGGKWGWGPRLVALKQTGAWTAGLKTESSYDWTGDQWFVPINASASKVFHVGRQPVSLGGGIRYFAEGAGGAPRWGMRLFVTALFPR